MNKKIHKLKSDVKMLDKEYCFFLLRVYQYFADNKKTILLFIVVGTISAIVNLGSFSLLWNLAGINYQLAVSIAYLFSVIVHFSANRCIAFESKNTHFVRQMPRYLTMIFINYCITLMVTRFVVEVLSLTPYFGIILSIGVTINTSYFMLRYWVFPKVVEII